MRKKTVVTFIVSIAVLAGGVWGYQNIGTIAALSRVAFGAVTPGDLKLQSPTQEIVAAAPLAITTTREDTTNSVTHTYQYLLCPDSFSNEPGRGHFVNTGNEITFYLDAGVVYVTHTSDPANASLSDQTRPRVRTKRSSVVTQGTIFAVEVMEDADRIMALKLETGESVKITCNVGGAYTTMSTEGQYCDATSTSPGTPAAISGNGDAKLQDAVITALAERYGLDLP